MDLPDPGIKSGSPALQEDSLSAELPGKPGSRKCLEYKCSPGKLCRETELREVCRMLESVVLSLLPGALS